jgi:hypothetical protein
VEAGAAPERRRALIVANAHYDDAALEGLASPAQDAAALTRVLEDPKRCGFDVSAVVDAGSAEVTEAVEGFLVEAERSDLLLLYFSCHGLKDESGRLYFATRNTRRNRLRSTAVPAGLVNDLLLGSRSRRKVLLLDCCYGGAFAKGMQVKADPSVHTGDQFDARGLVVLTASDSTQYAFDGDLVRGTAEPSRFTSVLVSGLSSGEADLDQDGFVTVDDAYEFVRRRLSDEAVPQDPRKWEFDVAGRIVLSRSGAGGELRAAPLPSQVPAALASHPRAGTDRLLQPIWWASSLALLAACVAVSWLLVRWLEDPLTAWVDGEHLPDTGDLAYRVIALAAAWAVGYALVSPPSDRRTPVSWGDPWRPLLHAYDNILRPTGVRPFLRGLVLAVPINVLLVCAGSLIAARAGYGWNGSESRDNFYRLAFVVLALLALGLSFLPARRR